MTTLFQDNETSVKALIKNAIFDSGHPKGGLPKWPLIVVIVNERVIWQPDGEVKTLGRKPANG